ncbi:hypothetical protein E0Z06_14865 [Rheinheimera sp. D18]|uniref:hypothetical protein n=1 Tax=Rheinheimera sp. D18 TaxID=2545632 RepID=UPI0010506EB7|nr:hypothetical protein [Rheinheimera sp. D18]QBL10712.1 hypothetical protein E0Z06_14865 [Rheinheimera sp. D18]
MPHRGAALWLDSVSVIAPTYIVGTTTADCLRLYGPNCPSYLLYEAAAQLCAVHGASISKITRRAYVVKVQKVKIYQITATAMPVTVSCELLSKNEAGAQYQFEVSQTQPILSGTLLVAVEHVEAAKHA